VAEKENKEKESRPQKSERSLWEKIKSDVKNIITSLIEYLRETRIELRKVRWPTREQVKTMTQIVLGVTIGMAVFLGILDFFFGWLLRGLVSQNMFYIILSVVVVAALAGVTYLIGQGEEV